MKFRPCIDIHNGKVKQIVGGSLKDDGNQAFENFVSEQDAAYYARLYQKHNLDGGHIILLNPHSSKYYPYTYSQALLALHTWPGSFQIGGGITVDNIHNFLNAGASHVIVTSYVFQNGRISINNLNRLVRAIGRERLVLDLSCRKKDGHYYIVTDRWQTFTDVAINLPVLEKLSSYCNEFLVHAVDVEGRASGIETGLVRLLAHLEDFPVTYAGGIGSYQDLSLLKEASRNHLDVTIGSALDLFGGDLSFQKVLEICRK
ncbi:MAG: phosphoribosylformimino-5-aminoimidazole carboxamide ribotide isomerase [Lachnospiraceae bacterium]|nr:phosphoribosylformimino-5-aminoimidazole carboxamide ribotide isomerase [Lachnospiraceae bacterium]